MKTQLIGRAGMKIRADGGCEQLGFPEMLSTPIFYHANPGDRLILIDKAYKYNVATYRPEVKPEWLYTYCYAPDQSWTIYNNDLSGDSYRQDDYIFGKEVYFRVCLRKANGRDFSDKDDINNIVKFEQNANAAAIDTADTASDATIDTADTAIDAAIDTADSADTANGTAIDTADSADTANDAPIDTADTANDAPTGISAKKKVSSAGNKAWLTCEVTRTSAMVNRLRAENDPVFIMLTDSHYNVNGTWSDTAQAIKLLCENIKPDAIIHLGDLTDGMVTADALRYYTRIILTDLKSNNVPVYITPGNHDNNYFRNNPERLTEEEQRNIYLDGRDIRYYTDYPGLRLIFPDSFDPSQTPRYGYCPECIVWLEETLRDMPETSKAIICSHLPPLARLQYWSDVIRGEEQLMEVLKQHKDKILTWINGHNHADVLDNNEGFPIISIANAKCEAYLERKPEGFITPHRQLNDVSQELFDVMLVNTQDGNIRFVRFGAGDDRVIENGNAQFIIHNS